MLAYGIWLSGAEAAGTVLDRRRAAGAAGAATMTASASRYSGSAAEPTVSRQPACVRSSARTIALVRMSAFDALATASGSAPSPVVSVTNTGAGAERSLLLSVGDGREQRGDRTDQRRMVFRGGGQRGQRRLEGELVAAAGVDAAEQRVDEPV